MKRLALILVFISLAGLACREADVDLDRSSDKLYRVNVDEKSIEFITQTAFDPKSSEGETGHLEILINNLNGAVRSSSTFDLRHQGNNINLKPDEAGNVLSETVAVAFKRTTEQVEASQARGKTATNKPNILFIMSDDLNTALSGYGHPECKTPNLDRFAKSGVSFTRAFCQFPLCAPSRASIMSGQYPVKNGVTGNGGRVDPARITLPRHFANHGYWTARVSKIYHMGIPGDIITGGDGGDHEQSWGQRHNISALETLTPGKVENFTEPDSPAVYPAERAKWQAAQSSGGIYKMPKEVRGDYAVVEVENHNAHLLPDTMAADKAIELLRERAGHPEPFFLAVGFVRPHFPFVSISRTIGQYQSDQLAVPRFPQNDHDDMPGQAIGRLQGFEDPATQKLRRGYYGAIGFMDQQVGRLLAELDRLKLRENTIIVFVSDHGYLLGEHRMWKKSRLWEEAIRVPLIISAPGRKQDMKSGHTVELLDLYPTLTELANLPMEPGVQGQSLTPLLDDPKATLARQDALIQVGGGFGLRSGKWAYMWYPASKKFKQEGVMLYDLEQDPQQFTNLATDPNFAPIRKRLHQRLTKRLEDARN